MMAGILVGVIIGVCIAAGLAWYLMKSPSPFLHKEPLTAKPSAGAAQQNPPEVAADPGVSGGKPRFEFYKVLTDKQDKTMDTPAKPTDKPKVADRKPAVGYEPHLLQVGSFHNADEAEKRKGELAFLGFEASVQSATIPEKGVWYRVRLGPYKTEDELNRASSFLKQKGFDSTPTRAQ